MVDPLPVAASPKLSESAPHLTRIHVQRIRDLATATGSRTSGEDLEDAKHQCRSAGVHDLYVSKRLGKTVQTQPVTLTLRAHEVRVGRTEHVYITSGCVRVISGSAWITYSMPLPGESRPKVSNTFLPSTPN
jgi:hypothetical protein